MESGSNVIRPTGQALSLTADRALAFSRVLLATTIALVLLYVALSVAAGGWDYAGKPLGTDFLCFWTAARLALTQPPSQVYSAAAQYALERATFAARDPGYYAFIYPPITLLICLPLGLIPYFVALPVWLVTTGAAYFGVVWTFLDRSRQLIPPILAFPAVLLNCGHGQTAFLTTALFGGAVLSLQRRPILAGFLFGSLVIKPHLGLLIPIYLLAGGYSATFMSACATVAALAAMSLVAFGPAAWTGYGQAMALARMTLEQGLVEPEKMTSVFAAVRLWHGAVPLAYSAQLVVAVLAAGAMAVLARRKVDPLAGGAALVTAALMATPYSLDYDLALLAIPLAWLIAQARRIPLRQSEAVIGTAGFLLPLVSRLIATDLSVPLGPIVIASLLWVICRRASPISQAWDRPSTREGRAKAAPSFRSETALEACD